MEKLCGEDIQNGNNNGWKGSSRQITIELMNKPNYGFLWPIIKLTFTANMNSNCCVQLRLNAISFERKSNFLCEIQKS